MADVGALAIIAWPLDRSGSTMLRHAVHACLSWCYMHILILPTGISLQEDCGGVAPTLSIVEAKVMAHSCR